MSSRTKEMLILRVLTWLHLLGVPALISATTSLSHLTRPSGRVTLFSFERGHLRTITDNVNTEVVLTASPRYFEAYLFECNATFPVQWAYIGEAAPVVTADVGRFFQDFYDVNTYTYQSILLMYTLQELQSGRYICRGASKEHDKLAIHYDVFVPGNATQILLSTTEKKLFIPENKEHAYIPCGVSDSTAVINLYRGNQWGTFYPVPVNGSITFNPRKGFKIRFKDFLDPWGTYLCVSESNKRRRKVHLIPETLKAKYDLINHVSGKIPVYFSYEYEYNRVLCCTGTNFIPKMQWAGCGSILDCQVKSACYEEDRCEQRLGMSGYNPSKWIDPGPLPPGCSGYKLRDDPNGDFGLFKCSTPGIAQYQPYLLNRGNIFLDFEKTPPSEMILTLQRISPEGPSYVGDELEFHCNSTRFYFAYGIRWGWEKHGGEIDFVDDANAVRDKYSIRGHRRRTTFRIPHANIKSIICFVPVVNSATEWRTVSLPVVITAQDPNLLPHQNPAPPPPNNVIDLDAITYHTDYDPPNSPHPVSNDYLQPPEPPQAQLPPQAQPLHQQQQPADLQVYNSAKAPHQEFHIEVPSSSAEQQDHHNRDANYYNYGHESSAESPSNNIDPLSEPQTIDIFVPATYSQASTPAPNIIAISRSNKKGRSRHGGSGSSNSKTVPVPKPDVHYDIISEKDFNRYDSFEPKPSSSSNSNSRLQNAAKAYHRHQKLKTASSGRIPHPQYTSSSSSASSSSSSNRRPSSSSSRDSSYRRQSNNYRDEEILYPNPLKTYRDIGYDNYNQKQQHEITTDEMRLSLPFEPILPSSSRGRHPFTKNDRHNYTTIPSSRDSPHLRVSSSSSRSNSRRPSSTSQQPAHSHAHHSSSSSSRHHHSRQPEEKEYSIDDSFSQHVRLSLPSNSISTQLPKLQKSGRSRGRARTQEPSHGGHSHSRGRSHTSHAPTTTRGSSSSSSHHHTNNHPRNPDYYYTDDSPVEIKVPRTKSHEPYRHSRPHHQYHQQTQTQRERAPSHTQHRSKDEHVRESSIEPPEIIVHDAPPTTYTRRRPHSEDLQSRPTSHVHGRDRDRDHHQHHSPSSSNDINSSMRQYYYQHGRYHQIPPGSEHTSNQENYKPSASGRHRSYSRGMKFAEPESNPKPDGGGDDVLVTDSYEFISPTARPAYYLATTPKYGMEVSEPVVMVEQRKKVPTHPHHQNSNELANGAYLELKRLQPQQPTSPPYTRPTPVPIELRRRPTTVNPKMINDNSSDIMHSVSINISSRLHRGYDRTHRNGVGHNGHNSHSHNGGGDELDQILAAAPLLEEHHISTIDDGGTSEAVDSVAHESEDYDIYSPKYTNYKVTTNAPSKRVPIMEPLKYYHVQPTDMSSFQPAKSIIDEDDEDEMG